MIFGVIKMDLIKVLTEEFEIKPRQAENVIKLLDGGNTVPFIARYRKEMTGAMDDQLLRSFADRLSYLRNLDEMRKKIKNAAGEAGALTDDLIKRIENAATLSELDDIYLPFKKKRKTRADAAKEKGLEPLADEIYAQNENSRLPIAAAEDYINEELGVTAAEDALKGAGDIIAERISFDADVRKRIRFVCSAHGVLKTKAAKEDVGVYEMYADYSEAVSKIPSHRILAVNRGEKEDFLKVSVEFDKEKAMYIIEKAHIKPQSACRDFMIECALDSYQRLIFPSIEREIRNELTEKASKSAISVFSSNLRQLLMQPPVKGSVTMGLDPGYRTGCKVAVIDETGKVLDTSVIYPAPPHNKIESAEKTVSELIKKYNVKVIAIGNGTAGRETEAFAADLIKKENLDVAYSIVSEAGASVYSASKFAAEEFPEYDVSLRSAVSIARRLEDPLAELVKIDPKAIGVGQYQHDMPQKELSGALDGVVEECVNKVGVDLNTASVSLLSKISGINSAVADNIVKYRDENGGFVKRSDLKKVSKLGSKAFEQCAGFLRIENGANALDATAVHPESYEVAKNLLKICGFTENDVKEKKISGISEKLSALGEIDTAEKLGVGVLTLKDIASELEKPWRDPRDEIEKPMLRRDVLSLDDLKPGMELEGTVRNIIDFGAFVDIGVHEDGLVHISQISRKFIKHPIDVLKVGQTVTVWVMNVDKKRNRISLTMKKENALNETENE